MNYLVDYHMHSINSIDGKDTVSELCESAVKKGLSEIVITDHFEPTNENPGADQYKPNVYWTDILKARLRYKGKINIKMGVELGQPHHFKETSELLLNSLPYDYVIGSAHKFSKGNDVSELDFSKITLDELCRLYLLELKELAEWGRFDCVGHLDLIKRYSTNFYKTRVTLFSQYDLLKDVLKTIILKGKGIEINTSGLRQAPQETMPGIDVLKLYRELGGEILTVGSDGHNSADIGKGIVDAVNLAKEAGFSFITLFNSRLPKWIRIDDKKHVYGVSV